MFRRTRTPRMRCRTVQRGRQVVSVTAHLDGADPVVALHCTAGDALILTPQQVGWLRGELRACVLDAVQHANQLADDAGRHRA